MPYLSSVPASLWGACTHAYLDWPDVDADIPGAREGTTPATVCPRGTDEGATLVPCSLNVPRLWRIDRPATRSAPSPLY